MSIQIEKDLVEAINHFEENHKKYLEKDGSLNNDGWDYLHDAEVNWADDIKWNDYIKFHMQPRVSEFWDNSEEDKKYKEHWKFIHPKLFKKYWESTWE